MSVAVNIELYESQEFEAFCQTMYIANCSDWSQYNEEIYPSVEDYLTKCGDFLRAEFVKSLKQYVRNES